MIKVLVIDDENKTREFIAKLIRSFGQFILQRF